MVFFLVLLGCAVALTPSAPGPLTHGGRSRTAAPDAHMRSETGAGRFAAVVLTSVW